MAISINTCFHRMTTVIASAGRKKNCPIALDRKTLNVEKEHTDRTKNKMLLYDFELHGKVFCIAVFYE